MSRFTWVQTRVLVPPCIVLTEGPNKSMCKSSLPLIKMLRLVVSSLTPPSDGSVGQLLLLAHHRGSGDLSEASGHAVEDGCGRVWRAFRRAFRRSGGDSRRDGAFFQPSCQPAVRMGATDDLSRENVGVDVGEVHPAAGIPVNNNICLRKCMK